MGISLGWERYVESEGKVLSIETFGASGTDVMVNVETSTNKSRYLKVRC